MEEAKQNSNTEHDYFAKWQEAERKVAELEKKLENAQASMYCDVVDSSMLNVKYQDKVKRMTECLKNCKDVFNAVGPELLGSDNLLLIQGVASAQNWVQRILDEPDVTPNRKHTALDV